MLELVRGVVQKIAKMLGFGTGGAEGVGEIGEEVTFNDGEESHRLWVDVQGASALLMVASTEMTVADRIADWQSRLSDLPEESRAEAQGLLSQAQSLSGKANEDSETDWHRVILRLGQHIPCGLQYC